MKEMHCFSVRAQKPGRLLCLLHLLALPLFLLGQEVIYREDFSGYPDGAATGSKPSGYWSSFPYDCDDGGLINVPGPNGNQWGVFDNVFVISDIEGNCCPSGVDSHSRNLIIFTIDISGYCDVSLSLLIYGSGGLECDPDASEPDFTCLAQADHDQVVVDYAVDSDTSRAVYICGSNRTGTIRENGISGDTLKIFIYPSTRDDNEFYALDNILVTGVLPPEIDPPTPVYDCSEYILPEITGQYLSGNQAYYSAPNGQGEIFHPGRKITRSDTLYLYDEKRNCSDQDTLIVLINPTTRFNLPDNQQACRQYTLPPIVGEGLSGHEAYYTGPAGTGEELFPGAIVTSSQILYIHDPKSACQQEVSFPLTIDTPPEVSFTVSSPSCFDNADGSIKLNIFGKAPFVIDWSVDRLDGKDLAYDLQAGYYDLTITDHNLCDTSLRIVLLQPPPLDINCSVVSPALTPRGNEGIAEISFSNGSPPYLVEWSGPVSGTQTLLQQGIFRIPGLKRGEYSVSITDSQSCLISCSFSVSGPPCDLVLQVDKQSPTCFDSSNGWIFTKINTSHPPFQIDWDDNRYDTQDTLLNLSVGTYNVTVTDQIGCVVMADIEITQPNPITLVCQQSSPVSRVGGSDGKAGILLAGGARPYQLSWSGPVSGSLNIPQASNLTLKDLPTGEYTLVAVDAKGCTQSCVFTIRGPTCNLLLFMLEQKPVICSGDSSAAINLGANNGRRPYTYSWSGPTPIGNIEDPLNLSAGEYKVTVTDAVGCSNSSGIIIADPPPLFLFCEEAAPVSHSEASDGSANIMAGGGTGPYDFVWKGPSRNDQFTLVEEGSALIQYLSVGHYDVTVTDERGCEQICNFDITTFECKLTVDANVKNISCANADDGSVSFTVQNEQMPVHINWNIDSLDGIASAFNLSPGHYEVTFTDTYGCLEIRTFTLLDPPPLSLQCSISNPIMTVNGHEGRVSAIIEGGTAPYLLEWAGPEIGMLTSPGADTLSLDSLSAGKYFLKLIDANNCVQTCSFELPAPDCSTFYIDLTGENLSCYGSADGSAILTIQDKPSLIPPDIDWSMTAWEGQTAVRGLSKGWYAVTVTNAQQCILQDSLFIEEPDELIVTCIATHPASPNGGANGQAQITITGGTAPYTLQWNGPVNGEQQLMIAEQVLMDDLLPGNYSVLVIDQNGCMSSCNFQILEFTCTLDLTYEIGDVSCAGSADGYIQINPTGNTGPVTIVWDQDEFDGMLHLEHLTAGSYQLQLKDSIGCERFIGFFVDEPAPIEFSISSISPACSDAYSGSILIENLSGGTPPYEIELNENPPIYTGLFPISFSSLSAGNYSILLTDHKGCRSQISLTLEEDQPLLLQLEEDKTIFRGQKTTIETLVLNFEPVAVRWTPQTGLAYPDRISTEASPIETTTYTLSLTHASGCTVSDQIRINIDNRRRIFIPNAFRPESSENNRFTIFGGKELQRVAQLLVFDRWGALVFEAMDFPPNDPSQGWNGYIGGNLAQSGIYVYAIEVIYADTERELFHGEVFLMR